MEIINIFNEVECKKNEKANDLINVCFAIDNNYAEHCAAVIGSILDHSDSHFNFYILNSGIKRGKKIKFENLKNFKEFKLTFVDFNLDDFKRCYVPPNSHFRLSNYFRLKIPSLLSSLEKVIYLDSDVIVNKDLRELWDISFDEHYVLGCKSMTYKKNCERLNLQKDAPYINSGVLVLNLEKMRISGIEEKFFQCISENPTIMQNVDQDVINLVLLKLKNGIKQIVQNWNTEVRTDIPFEEEYLGIIRNPFIIHFITNDKPWNEDTKQLYKEKYLKYAKLVSNYSNSQEGFLGRMMSLLK